MKYDKKTIQAFLMHLAGELGVQRHGLVGTLAGAKLLSGVQKLRAKYGTSLLPAIDMLDILDGADGGDQPQHHAARKAAAEKIAERMKHVLAVMEMLGELTFIDDIPV